MDSILWGWIVMGAMTLGNFVICVRLIVSLLEKLGRCEDRLMAMSEAYPHQAMIAMQQEAFRASQAAGQPMPIEQTPEWQTQAAS